MRSLCQYVPSEYLEAVLRFRLLLQGFVFSASVRAEVSLHFLHCACSHAV